MISIDSSILDANSTAWARMKEYAALVQELHILVLKKGQLRSDGNLFVYPASCFSARPLAKKLIRRHGLDVVTTQDPFVTASLGRWLKKKCGLKFNVQMHGDFFSPYFREESLKNKLFYWYMRQFILAAADSFRVVSERIKKSLLHAGVSEEKIIVAPIYVDVKKYAEASAGDDLRQIYGSDHIILFLGSLVKVKNVSLLIQAFKQILPFFPSTTLLLAGDGQDRPALEEMVKRQQLNERVRFLGMVRDPRHLLQSVDCLVLSSRHEGYGRVIIEALATPTVVVMSNVGVADDIVRHNENGLIFPVDRLDLLEHYLIEILADKNKQMALKEQARLSSLRLPDKEAILNKIKQSWS